MHRISFVILAAALIACGSGEGTQSSTGAGEMPPVSATAPADEPGSTAGSEAVVSAVIGCIDLVGAGRFCEAVPVCIEELRITPDDAEIQSALARAQAAQAGGEGAAAEAAWQAAAAVGETQGRADGALRDATGGIPGGLGD